MALFKRYTNGELVDIIKWGGNDDIELAEKLEIDPKDITDSMRGDKQAAKADAIKNANKDKLAKSINDFIEKAKLPYVNKQKTPKPGKATEGHVVKGLPEIVKSGDPFYDAKHPGEKSFAELLESPEEYEKVTGHIHPSKIKGRKLGPRSESERYNSRQWHSNTGKYGNKSNTIKSNDPAENRRMVARNQKTSAYKEGVKGPPYPEAMYGEDVHNYPKFKQAENSEIENCSKSIELDGVLRNFSQVEGRGLL